MMIEGIDISHYQGAIDWNNFSEEFVIIKASEGLTYVDPLFMANNKAVVARGIAHGFYHFVTGEGADLEAAHFCSTLGQLDPGEVLAIDYETNLADPVGYVLEMAKYISNHFNGLKPLIYLNSSLCLSHDWTPLIQLGCGLWIASYGTNSGEKAAKDPATKWWTFYAMWQYTSKGAVAGVAGSVDRDTFNGDKEQFLKYGYKPPQPTPTPEPTPVPQPDPSPAPLPEPLPIPAPEPSPLPSPTPPADTTSLWDFVITIWNIIVNFLKGYKKT